MEELKRKKEHPSPELLSINHLLDQGDENSVKLVEEIFQRRRASEEKAFIQRTELTPSERYSAVAEAAVNDWQVFADSLNPETEEVEDYLSELEEKLARLEKSVEKAGNQEVHDAYVELLRERMYGMEQLSSDRF